MANQLPSAVATFNGLNNAIDTNLQNLASLNEVNIALVDARKQLVEARNAILNEYNDLTKHPDGQKALGGNEGSRAAAIDSMVSKERDLVEALEARHNQLRYESSVNMLELDRWKFTLRLLETGGARTDSD